MGMLLLGLANENIPLIIKSLEKNKQVQAFLQSLFVLTNFQYISQHDIRNKLKGYKLPNKED